MIVIDCNKVAPVDPSRLDTAAAIATASDITNSPSGLIHFYLLGSGESFMLAKDIEPEFAHVQLLCRMLLERDLVLTPKGCKIATIPIFEVKPWLAEAISIGALLALIGFLVTSKSDMKTLVQFLLEYDACTGADIYVVSFEDGTYRFEGR